MQTFQSFYSVNAFKSIQMKSNKRINTLSSAKRAEKNDFFSLSANRVVAVHNE